MNPLVLKFKEIPTAQDFDFSQIEYSADLNLSIDVKTGLPAISFLNMETETVTKSHENSGDSDYDRHYLSMETMTGTFNDVENSDSDNDRLRLQAMMATETVTLTTEATDQDKDWK